MSRRLTKIELGDVSAQTDCPRHIRRMACTRSVAIWLCMTAAVFGALAIFPSSLRADDASEGPLRVAVAANFVATAERIAQTFQRASGIKVSLTSGATGHLFAQISQGAPFDVFLAADQERAARAVSEGLALQGSQRTYALGQLVLFVPGATGITSITEIAQPRIRRIAIANPGTAPYGAAALAVLRHSGVLATVRPKLVNGQNVLQALQFVVTGNAEVGFVAKSLVLSRPTAEVIAIPPETYPPIRQDAVIIAASRQQTAAQAFLDYLLSATARDIIVAAGYRVPED